MAGGAQCIDSPGRNSLPRRHGENEGVLAGGELGQLGGGLRLATKKGGGGGQSPSGMVLRARRIENGDGDQKWWKRARSRCLS
jgi:hypothetical protein